MADDVDSKSRAARETREEFPIIIIGAGFAGIGTAIQLKKSGIHSFRILERANEIGGTWRDNRYPGAACDVPSHVYSFSFELNPDWSRIYASSDEIQAYLLGLVEKWDLRSHLQLGLEVTAARFSEEEGVWELQTSDEEIHRARVVVSGVGGLVDPALPDIPGLDSFAGSVFHTARWNQDLDLAGKRVGVIGTGASAVQVVPGIASEVAKLSVFQRTPGWVVPKRDRRYSQRMKRLYARFPILLKLSRYFKYWMSEIFGPMIFLDSPRLSSVAEKASLNHLNNQVSDPDLRAKLRPDFQFGCKRILISDDYWASFERDNVDLVIEGIERIESGGIRTRDGALHELDVLVLATGFELGLAAAPFPIAGRQGLQLDRVWARGASAYKGHSVSGFPNWFIIMGPNTGPGHTSVIVYTEAQIAFILEVIKKIRKEGIRYVDVRREVQESYNAGLQRRMPYMVWQSGCNSWYISQDGGNRSLYPGFAAEYVLRARRFKASEYEIAYD